MPSQTILVRSHARTIHTRPITFICAQCKDTTTRECYPGRTPKYCVRCRPRKKKSSPNIITEKGMFIPTHYLIAPNNRKTEVCLEKTTNPGWYGVRTALDWFSGSSIIQYHQEKGLVSNNTPLEGYNLILIPEELSSSIEPVTTKGKLKAKAKKERVKDFDIVSVENRAYSNRQLMKRFKCGDRLLKIKRSQPDFAAWSKERDPEGVVWKYQDGHFLPLLG